MDGNEQRGLLLRVMALADPGVNEGLVVNQLAIQGARHNRRLFWCDGDTGCL